MNIIVEKTPNIKIISSKEKILTSHKKFGKYLSDGNVYKIHRYQRNFRWNFDKNALSY